MVNSIFYLSKKNYPHTPPDEERLTWLVNERRECNLVTSFVRLKLSCLISVTLKIPTQLSSPSSKFVSACTGSFTARLLE